MQSFGTADVARLAGVTVAAVRSMVRARYVAPQKGARGSLRFSFRDVVMLRAARDLLAAEVPARRLGDALRALHAQLPPDAPPSGLSICAVGDQVVVQEGGVAREPRSGQLLLGFEVRVEQGRMRVVDLPRPGPAEPDDDCEAAFQAALELEASDPDAAVEAYRQCLARHGHPAVHANLGRLLHLRGKAVDAVALYRGIDEPDAVVLFNLGVALEDLGEPVEAIEAYERALQLDEELADAHHNLGQLLLGAGDRQRALRHLSRYRALERADRT